MSLWSRKKLEIIGVTIAAVSVMTIPAVQHTIHD